MNGRSEPSSLPVEAGNAQAAVDGAIEPVLWRAYGVPSGDTDWAEVVAACGAVLDGLPVVLFVFNAETESLSLLGASPSLAAVPDAFLHVARRAGRRLKARLPSRLVGGRLPSKQRYIIEEVATWNSLAELETGYVTSRLLRGWESAYLCLAVGGEPSETAATAGHRRLADLLLPHLARAAELERRLHNSSIEFNLFTQVLDRFPIGIVALDGSGAVTHANSAALRLTRERRALSVSRTGVHALSEASETELQRHIAEAIADERGDYFARLHVADRDGDGCGVALISIQSDGSRFEARPRCVLFVAGSALEGPVTPEALCDFLGLTMAEARIVAELVGGHSVAEASARIGVTANTGRTLLGRAMARTRTSSQTGLMRKIFSTMVQISEER